MATTILALRDGNGNPVEIAIQGLTNGTLQPQSTPVDATGAPYCATNPLPTADAALRPALGDAAAQVASASLGEVLAALMREQRLTNLILAQAFGIADNVDALRHSLR